ncbi:MAG: hypothetical protein ABIN97_03050, partial [Ginsengibacter sp.]
PVNPKGLQRTTAVSKNLNQQVPASSNQGTATNQYQQLPLKNRNQPDNNLSAKQPTLSTAATNQYGAPPVAGKAATNQYQQLPLKNRNQPDNNISSNQPALSNAATNKNQYQQLPLKNRNQPDNNLSSKQPTLSTAATNQYGAPPVVGQAATNKTYTAAPAAPARQTQQVNQNNASTKQTPGNIKNTQAFKNVESKLAPSQQKAAPQRASAGKR